MPMPSMVESVPPTPTERGLRSSTTTVIGRLPSGPMASASTKRTALNAPSRFSRSCPAAMSSGSKGSPSGRSAMKAMNAGSVRRLPRTTVLP